MRLLEDLGRFNMNRKFLSSIIGRQIVRIDFARSYFAIIMSIFTALSMFSIYLSTINITITLFDYATLLSIAMLLFWILGYAMDKFKIIDADRALRNEKSYIATRNLWENSILPPLEEMLNRLIEKKLKEE